MRKIFLDDLPRGGKGVKDTNINWNKSKNMIVKFTYDEIIGDLKILDYDGKYLYIGYLDNDPFKISRNNFIYCKIKGLLNLKTSEYRYQLNEVITNEVSDIIIKKRTRNNKSNEKSYEYMCLNCNNIDVITESHLKSGQGCNVCSGHKTLVGYNDINTTNPELIRYFFDKNDVFKYKINSNKVVRMVCPLCGTTKNMRISDLNNQGFSCPSCGDGFSYPNKVAYNILRQLNIDFETEKKFDWCVFANYKDFNKIYKGSYDFYFIKNSKEYIIEMDGIHHKTGRQNISIEEQRYIDSTKDKLAMENGIKVIRIDCSYSNLDFIKNNMLKSDLSKILKLNDIDWNKCEINSIPSIVKEACDLYNKNMLIKDIAKELRCSLRVIEYLKRGTKLNWCNYDPKKSKSRHFSIKADVS